MPSIPTPTPRERLEHKSVKQLKTKIRDLNSRGHSITLTAPRKSILVQRIINALDPPTNTQLPTISSQVTTAIDTETALAKTVTIDSEIAVAHAASILSSLSSLKEKILKTFDKNKENWKAEKSHAAKGLKDAIEMEETFTVPIDEAISIINTRVSSFRLQQHLAQQRERDELERETKRLAESAIQDKINELLFDGDLERASELEESLNSGSLERHANETITNIPTSSPSKVKGVSTSFPIRWKLVDVKKLPPKYTKVIANTVEIDREVARHGLKARGVIGDGVEVWQDVTTRGTGR